ncbi:MAG TPA: hypothetical protein VKR21_05495, partial [Solirubrobacteraceae bacterium]|nr:hypothetical protein [Solirubrobacteraceae bacterium]
PRTGVSIGSAGLASCNFTSQPNTALLVTDQSAQSPTLWEISPEGLCRASTTVTGLIGAFDYYGQVDACGGTMSCVRYYFETSNAGGVDETHYWWSNPVSLALSDTDSPVSLIAVPLKWRELV